MNYELREYSFGETIGKGFNLYFNNFIFIFLTSFIAYIPLSILTAFMASGKGAMAYRRPEKLLITMGISGILMIFIFAFLSAVIITLLADKYLNNNSSISLILKKSLSRVLPIVGMFFLIMLVVGVIGVFLGVIAGLLAAISKIFLVITVPLIITALVFAVIYGIGFMFATHSIVLENSGVIESFKRSWFLTNGSKGIIFGLMILVSLMGFAIALPFSMGGSFLLLKGSMVGYTVLTHLANTLVGPIGASIYVVMYFNCRIKKEGFNVEHLAEQFSLAKDAQAE